MIPGQAQQFFEAAAAQSGGGSSYEIERSLRFNSGDTAYLNKTLSSGNRRTWTLSFWVKRWNQSSTTDGIFCAYNGSISEDNYAIVQFGSDDQFYVTYAYANYIRTNRVFRDPSSWYHIVVVVDTNNSTAGDRVQLYVNGVRETDFAATHDPDSGQELAFNQACPHYIGSEVGQFYSDCYYAEMHFVDGTALGPTDFGEFDVNNNWNAKEYSGSYGTNGFYLKFNDNSSASALGTDSSGNSNTWTVNNLSVSAGVDNDSLRDSPTDGDTANDTGVGGEIPGNYCVINNLGRSANNPTVSDGNLKMVLGAAQGTRHGTMGVTSGKWYFEVVYTAASPLDAMVGVANRNHENNLGNYIGGDSDSWGYYYNGQKYHPGQSGAYGDGWGVNDVMGIALDMDNGALYFSKNGTYQNSGDPTSGASKTGAAFTNLSGTIFPGLNGYGGTQFVNFGQRPFNTSAPSGYKTWNTANLPTPTIANAADHFNIKTWTGTGSSHAITGYTFAPDFAWIKARNNAGSHALLDTVRGASLVLRSDGALAETNNTSVFSSFDSDGFTLGADTSNGWTNYNTWTYVGWAWNAGSSNTTINAGDLNSSAYNTSQTWSDNVTGGSGAYGAAANAFDGSLSTFASPEYSSPMTYTNPSPSDTVINTIELYLDIYTTSGITLELNDTDITSQVSTTKKWYTITGFSGDNFEKLYWRPTSGNYEVRIHAIKINGKILVDDDVTPPNVPTLSSTVRASTSTGFSIVSWTGNGSTSPYPRIAHGLSAKPLLYIVKSRDGARDWIVYTDVVDGSLDFLRLNTTAAKQDSALPAAADTNVFYAGGADINTSGEDIIAYCFAPVEGYSAFGTYTGNGSADGPFVTTGFRPRWIMIKSSSNGGTGWDWHIFDSERDTFNAMSKFLDPNTNQAEQYRSDGANFTDMYVDFVSNGFKLRNAYSSPNHSGATFIYAAFAERPFKTARAR